MNKEISELFWVAVDIVGGIILLTFLLATQSQARQLFSTLETRNHAEEVLAENKSWRGYEGTLVTSADICNLVATHSGEDSCTIAISTGVSTADWRAEGSELTTSNIMLTDTPNGTSGEPDWYSKNYNVTRNVAPQPNSRTKYSYLWGVNTSNRKHLNTILNDELKYSVKLYKDDTGVVRWVSVQSWPADSEIGQNGVVVR